MAMEIINGKQRHDVSTAEFADYMAERFVESHSMGGSMPTFNKAKELLGTLIQIMFERGECKTTMFSCHTWDRMYHKATKLVIDGCDENGKDGARNAVQQMIEGLRKAPAPDPKSFLDC